MEEKIKIYFDNGRFSDYEKNIVDLCRSANALINDWHKLQSWHVIASEAEALELLENPAGRLDAVLIENSGIPADAKVKPDAQAVADLYKIDRFGWLQRIQKRVNVLALKKQPAIKWQQRAFIVLPEVIEAARERFTIYAETPKQKAIYQHYKNLVSVLSTHGKLGFISTIEMAKIAEAVGLAYVDNKLMINEIKLSQLIFS